MGGYIHYKHISGNTYEINVTLIQDAFSPAIARNEIEINYGDNSQTDTITKSSQTTIANSTFNVIKVIYKTQHTYIGAGTFKITVEDPNRRGDIMNFTNSSVVPIFLETSLKVSPLSTFINNSPTINSNIVVYSQANKDFRFNLAAQDEDGDFLTYRLVKSKGLGGNEASGYSFPLESSIDLINGELRWNNPSNIGYHQFTVEITECRNDEFISTTNVDFMVYNLAANNISSFYNSSSLDTNESGDISYIIAPGDSLSFKLNYQSNETFNVRLIDATNRASYSDSGDFKFVSTLDDNRCAPYLFVFEGNSDEILEFETVMIRVIDTNLINCDTLCGFGVLSLNKSKLNDDIQLEAYPNPFLEQTSINLPKSVESNYSFELFNSIGQQVKAKFDLYNQKVTLHRNDLEKGIYFFRITEKNGNIFTGKVFAQ